jgi:cytoskeletal protein RodZ
MEEFLRELKQAREAKGIPLAQISDITRIAEEHLQAIENGTIDLLPEVYLRAFLREYAEVVGLSPDGVMQKYDAATSGPQQKGRGPHEPAQVASAPPAVPAQTSIGSVPSASSRLFTASNARIALTIIVVATLAVIGWNLSRQRNEPPTEEIPFQTVLKQEEERLAPARSPAPAVIPSAPRPRAVGAGDSLLLRIVTTDSAWVMIQVDDQPARDYLFRAAGIRASWKAGNRFLVTLGNAGAVEFTLNDVSLGTLGKPGAVVRNVEIGRQNLTRP